jgi:hypothetical protein
MSILGNFFALYIAGQRVALATANNVSLKTDFEENTNKDSGLDAEYTPVKKVLSADIEAFHTSTIGNLVQFPEDLTQSVWVKDGVTISGTKLEDPFGQMHAQRILNITSGVDSIKQSIAGVSSGFVLFSVWLKGSGTITMVVSDEVDTSSQIITLKSDWVRYFVEFEITTGVELAAILESATGQTATQVDFFGPQFEIVSNVNALPSNYRGSTKLLADLVDAQDNGTKLTVRHSTDLEGDFQIAGDVYISGIDTKTKASGVNTFTAQLTGTATQTITTI